MEFVSYDIASNDFRRAGAASRSIKEHLKRIGAEAEAIRRTMIAAYEAEMNVVIHSVGGRLEASLSESQIDVNVVDDGPGIPDVEQAMVEGFSTASAEARALGFGAGMGLPNIRRNSDRLRITSRVDEGTRVSFTVYLKPENLSGPRLISVYASPDRCRDCKACLTACPTQAMRVRHGRPSILEHLCVDCGECIAACSTRALTVREEISSLDDLPAKEEMLLVVPPALLAGCGPDYPPEQVLAALRDLGFADVITSAPYEEALRKASLETACAGEIIGADSPGRTRFRPVIVPSCPAVVNLIELRFPSLVPHLAALDSPWEAVQATHVDRPVAYVVSCPSQRSALLAHAQTANNRDGTPGETSTPGEAGAGPQAEYLTPEVLRQAVMMKLAGKTNDAHSSARSEATATLSEVATSATDRGAANSATPTPTADTGRILTVTGMDHVMAVLEEVENGLLNDVDVIEPYSCEGGCFGSPLLSEDHHVASHRWERGRAAVEAAVTAGQASPITAVVRRRPFVSRPGIRLDPDMSRAIQKLGQLQAVIRDLPGRDCGACGAPTCAALAEDVVMGRAEVGLCPYIVTPAVTPEGGKEVRD
ncbi:MAG: hypothetical protein GXY46_08220 [Actinobacteria bacterium]|mgnify:FL=1|nr:hypothetical protein [Actinomycetota bacterium]